MEATWVDFGSFSEGAGGAFFLIFYWFSYDFVDIDVFDVDSRPRAILDQKVSKNGSNLGAKRVPNSIQNRMQKQHKKGTEKRAKNDRDHPANPPPVRYRNRYYLADAVTISIIIYIYVCMYVYIYILCYREVRVCVCLFV